LERRRREQVEAAARREEAEHLRQARLAEEEARRCAEEEARQERERIWLARLAEEEEERRRAVEEARQERERVRLARLAEEDEERRQAAEEARLERERAHQARLAQEEAARRAREAAAEERFQARSREEAALTMQRVILGSIVTFAAGLEVRDIITGFECCAVKIKNLPSDARDDEVTHLFTQQGIDPARFQLVGIRTTPNGKKEANVVTAADLADLLSFGLDGVEFRDERIEFEIGSYNLPGGMGASSVQDTDVLTVSWRSPSVRYVAEYGDYAQAQAKVRELNRTMYDQRRLHVEMNTPPPGRILVNFNYNSIKINNLPTSITDMQVQLFTQAFRVRRLPSKDPMNFYSVELAFQHLLREIERLSPGNIVHHERSTREHGRELDGTVSYRLRFSSSEDARVVYDGLSGRILPTISSKALWLRLPEPMCFNLTLPREQYTAQKKLWDALSDSITDRKACSLSIKHDGGLVRVRLLGSAKQAVGTLKVRVENLAAGDALDGWHRSLGFSNNPFLRRVLQETGAYLRSDWKKQVIRVYGEPRPVEQAREMVKAELERLEGLEYTVMLKQMSVAFFVRHGIATLKELIGEDSVTFHPWARRITISGGEEARHHLSRLIDESIRGGGGSGTIMNEHQCPICFDDVSSPYRVGCGHSYCSSCLRHFITSALEGDQFPLVCMGDEGRCARPIALPTIQAFLPSTKFKDLLETAVESYIKKHPAEIKYCKTPDCTQIYRATNGTASALQCPSCFTEVCSGCGEDAHKGVSCDEHRRITRWNFDDQWMVEQGFKKCPSCSAYPTEHAVISKSLF
jgi:hypothetical protein